MPTDLKAALKEASAYLDGELEKQALNPLESLLESIPDDAKDTLRNALIGGLIGGGGGAIAAGPDNRMRGLMAGTGLGAITGGAGTLGMKMLSGQLQFPGERPGPQSITARGAGGLTNFAAGNLGATLGTAGGGMAAYKYGPKSNEMIERLLRVAGQDSGQTGQAAQAALDALNSATPVGLGTRVNNAFRQAISPVNYSGPDLGALRNAATGPLQSGASRAGTLASTLSEALFGATKRGVTTTGALGSLGDKGGHLRAAGSELASAARINRIISALPANLKRSRLPWALLPAGAGIGYLVDKYVKGEY
jgi:hypothetical protein